MLEGKLGTLLTDALWALSASDVDACSEIGWHALSWRLNVLTRLAGERQQVPECKYRAQVSPRTRLTIRLDCAVASSLGALLPGGATLLQIARAASRPQSRARRWRRRRRVGRRKSCDQAPRRRRPARWRCTSAVVCLLGENYSRPYTAQHVRAKLSACVDDDDGDLLFFSESNRANLH